MHEYNFTMEPRSDLSRIGIVLSRPSHPGNIGAAAVAKSAPDGYTLLVAPGDPARTEFVQWLWYGESTLMTPLSRRATVTRLQRKGPDIDAVLEDAAHNTGVRLVALEQRLEGRDFLVAGRLTLADISAGYPLHLVGLFGLDHLLGPRSSAYRERLRSRPGYQRAISVP